MLTAGARILAGQLDPLSLYTIDSSHMLIVRADDLHLLLDL